MSGGSVSAISHSDESLTRGHTFPVFVCTAGVLVFTISGLVG